ncbi:unnamed protein product [Nesidiocoris tenuis]|uniref:C2H2-type domain-containing protein n=1 Tax=Nesidiocoris tenuis TaxID=355587 RepID=A0A6H5GFJ5_9HEMI|nr:unnamed protein product [Nesidiocoris tenuis]
MKSSEGDKKCVCDQCSKKFRTNRHLRDHVRRNHLYSDLHCYYCSYTAKLKFLLDKHMQKHLDPHATAAVKKYSCLLCTEDVKYECAARQFMLQHYVGTHNVNIETTKLEFQNIDKFNSWKALVEKVELCRYVSRGGVRRTPDCNIHWYRCFRDGVYKSKSKGKRKLKNKGSLKINSICPSSIRAVEAKDTGIVQVNYIPVHVGHGKELEWVNLSVDEKKELAEQLAANIPFNAVLASLRTSLNDTGDLERIHLTTRKDLWNIKRSICVSTNNSLAARSVANEPTDDEVGPPSPGTKVNYSTAEAPPSTQVSFQELKQREDPLQQIPGILNAPTKLTLVAQSRNSPENTSKESVDANNPRVIAVENSINNGEATVLNWVTANKSEPNIVRFYESQAPLLAENPENESTNYILNDNFSGRKKALIDNFFKLLDLASTEADLDVLEVNFSTFSMNTQQELFKNRVEAEDMVNVVCHVPNYV